MISEFAVDQTDLRFEAVAEAFDKETRWDEEKGERVETGELATNYDGTAYQLPMSVSFPKVERGLAGRESVVITVEVPIAGHEDFLKQVRGVPSGTSIAFQGGLRFRFGVSNNSGRMYQMGTGKGFTVLRAARSAQAQQG